MIRLNRDTRSRLRRMIGKCPLCSSVNKDLEEELGESQRDEDGLGPLRAVIYRRSAISVTMRCDKCGLQWTLTLQKIHDAAKCFGALAASLCQLLFQDTYNAILATI
jgi:hypothetical protein